VVQSIEANERPEAPIVVRNVEAAPAPRPPARRPALPLPPWGWRECAVGLVLAVFGLLLLSTIVGLALGGTKAAHLSVGQLLFGLAADLVLQAMLLSIAVGLSVGRYGGGMAVLGWRPQRPGRWFKWTLATVFMAWGTLLLYQALTLVPGLGALRPHGNIPEGIFNHPETVPFAVFLTAVVAPLVEETFFRGFLFNGLRRLLGFSGAAAVSGLLFAIVHAQPQLIIPFTIIGVLFAHAYYRTGTLWTNISAHCLFNLVSVIAALKH
jgi:membrane protease YdiL (CAAX protease family)